jgi:hypothetical protein
MEPQAVPQATLEAPRVQEVHQGRKLVELAPMALAAGVATLVQVAQAVQGVQALQLVF